MPAATAAADPPDDPPGTRPKSHGLRVTPKALFSVLEPMAYSAMLSPPRLGMPACFRRGMTVA